ncbi:MAG: hypothetical protein IJP96_02645 [Synergistaceae bacterium]|nr:hypothetical protein [Synergistaceae bacterium]
MESKKVLIGFRVDEAFADDFKNACASRGTTIKFVLSRAMKEYIARVKKEKPEESF